MVWAPRRGASVALFPEGTTRDGREVRWFRARLFDAAILAGTPAQPVALRFRDGDRLCHLAPFVGDDNFVPHLVRLAGHGALRAGLTFLEPVTGHAGQRGDGPGDPVDLGRIGLGDDRQIQGLGVVLVRRAHAGRLSRAPVTPA